MSNLLEYIVYYGYGNVRTTQVGADLSDFEYIEFDFSNPKTWCVCQLKEWLTIYFGLNSETYTVSVHALRSNSSTKILWHLNPIERTS
jgi:hypothetical protein